MVQENRQDHQLVTTLLLVDDEAPVLDAITWALENSGFRCYSANNMETALTILASHTTVSGVILDRGLVGAGLVAAVTRLRETAPRVTIVGTSGSDCRDEFLDAGADHFLLKPWTTSHVISLFGADPLTSEPGQA